MADKTSPPRDVTRKAPAPPAPAPAPQKPANGTAAAIKRFEKRYGETLNRLARR